MSTGLDNPINLELIEKWMKELLDAGQPVSVVKLLMRLGMSLSAARAVLDRFITAHYSEKWTPPK